MPYPKPPPSLGLQSVEKLLKRLAALEVQQPDKLLWGRYLRRHIRLYAVDGQVDLSERGLARATLADRILLRDSLTHLIKDLQ
jgi:hypothetical protein